MVNTCGLFYSIEKTLLGGSMRREGSVVLLCKRTEIYHESTFFLVKQGIKVKMCVSRFLLIWCKYTDEVVSHLKASD